MNRPALEAKGFQTSVPHASARRYANALATVLMAGALTLATLIVVATVSLEVVKAATL
ncbi:hypothetical protein X566_04860 [Afipia sp. P52-10]|jgi:hypothetical protein|uniref:hypothetical protein n=1 Tax=Afipia sp. P52-10 TaxID=1429916 RepID=UPI0003DF1C4B|nr:hypothetical protein [Afipia sp. P52-10]ETR78977.1 hypothetical protein X566_04860 [Afipia sp. P52-10]